MHDAARPLVETEQIEACLAAVRADGALAGAILAARSIDTLKLVEGDTIIATRPTARSTGRRRRRRSFAPRGSLPRTGAPCATATREPTTRRWWSASAVRVRVVESTRDNIKITVPEDLAIAEATLERRLLG